MTVPAPEVVDDSDSTPDNGDKHSVGSELIWTHRFCGGVIKDLRRKAPFYKSDFTDAFTMDNIQKTTSCITFLFFACLSPAIAFGTIFGDLTDGYIGVVEAIVSSGVNGIIFSLTAGQPLCILGGTGPGLAYTVAFYQMCKGLDVEFLPARVWQGLWCSLITVVMAVTDSCALMAHVTRYVEEIFSALISLIFIIEALLGWIKAFNDRSTAGAFLFTILCAGTYILAVQLRDIKKTNWMTRPVRTIISNFGVTIAIFSFTAISQIWRGVDIEWLAVPTKFEPTWHDPDTGAARSWIVNPFGEKRDLPVWVMFATFVPGLGMAVLNYLDQNLTTLLINRPTSGLKKPVGYHLDLLVCGALIYPICSFLGLPFPCAATVRSLTHLNALTTYMDVPILGGGSRRVASHVVEQRWTNFGIHVLITCSLLTAKYLRWIPKAVLFGVFLYMGISSIPGNQLFERLFLWGIWDPTRYPKYRYVTRVPFKKLHLFTGIQFVCLIILYTLKSIKEVAVAFPFYIALLIFVRKGLSRVFTPEELAELDAHEDLPPDAEDVDEGTLENKEMLKHRASRTALGEREEAKVAHPMEDEAEKVEAYPSYTV